MSSDSPVEAQPRRGWALFAVAIGIGLAAYFMSGFRADSGLPENPVLRPSDQGTVSLQIDFGDGRIREFDDIAWREGDTVRHVMQRASRSDTSFAFRQAGTGEGALVTAIDSQANEGGGDASRNWIFYVNSERATMSFAVKPVAAGDRVLWRLEGYEEMPPSDE